MGLLQWDHQHAWPYQAQIVGLGQDLPWQTHHTTGVSTVLVPSQEQHASALWREGTRQSKRIGPTDQEVPQHNALWCRCKQFAVPYPLAQSDGAAHWCCRVLEQGVQHAVKYG